MKKKCLAICLIGLMVFQLAFSVFAQNATDFPPVAEAETTGAGESRSSVQTADEEETDLAPVFELVAQSGELALYADLTGTETLGFFKVVNRQTGAEWYSNPLDAESDTIAKGKSKMELLSHIVVTYANSEAKKISTVPSRTGSINKKGTTVKRTDNGLLLTFDFPDDGFTIPLAVELQDGDLTVSVDFSAVKEYEENLVYSVQLLPYFAAVRENEKDGYLFLPDGSGALMYYHNGKTSADDYSALLYGRDLTVTVQQLQERKQAVRLPVFGAKTEDSAYLAIIEEGDGLATIAASVSGDTTCYNRAAASFAVRTTDIYRFGSGASALSQSAVVYSTASICEARACIRYRFLTGEQANYAGMATSYRDYLIQTGVLGDKVTEPLPFYMELLGGVVKNGTVLGFPVEKVTAMTDFDAAATLLKQMKEKGVSSVVIKYNNWNDDMAWERVATDADALSELGGNSGFQKLLTTASEIGAKVYPDVDLTFASRFSWFDGASAWSAKTISGTDAQTSVFRIDTFYKDTAYASRYLLSLGRREEAAAAFNKDYTGLYQNGCLSIGQLGDVLYSDYTEEGQNRQSAADRTAAMVTTFKQSGHDLLVSGGNAYLLSAATHLLDLEESSRHDLMDVSVPFYAMVVHGYRYYAGEAWNLSADNQLTFLRAIESGAAPHYYWCENSVSELVSTPYAGLYNGDADYWADMAAEQYAALAALHEQVKGQAIVSHHRDGEVSFTGYENGVNVIVNYGDETVTTEFGAVEGRGYCVTTEGAS